MIDAKMGFVTFGGSKNTFGAAGPGPRAYVPVSHNFNSHDGDAI